MKRFAYFATAALCSVLLLASCETKPTPITSDQSIVNQFEGGFAVASTGSVLRSGANESNSMKSSAYLYLTTTFKKNLTVESSKQDVTATISWVASNPDTWDITSPFDASHDKYVPTYPVKGSENLACTLTATVTYGTASNTLVYNITLIAKA